MLRENRVFPPPKEFAARARIGSMEEYEAMYARSIADPETFWAEAAKELHWFQPWTKVLDWQLPRAKWFVGGKLNLSYNCVDRHALGAKKDHVAILWEGEPADEVRRLTFGELHIEVQKFANVLKQQGIRKGDRVAVYMGMTPELAIALLACARIGAIHSVIFGGFAAHALVDRINDAQCNAVITQDASWRRGAQVPLKAVVDEALEQCPSVKHVIVYQRTKCDVTMKAGRDAWWHELMAEASDDCVRPKNWMPKTRCISCIPPARQGSRKGFCIPPAATRYKRISRRNTFLICATTMSSGVPQTLAG